MHYFFTPQVIGEKARAYQEMIDPLLTQGGGDKMFSSGSFEITLDDFRGSWEHLSERVATRNIYLQSVLLNYRVVPTWGSRHQEPQDFLEDRPPENAHDHLPEEPSPLEEKVP